MSTHGMCLSASTRTLAEMCGRGAVSTEHFEVLGTRSTALVYPSGFMRLAARSPCFASVAALVHEGWARARVPLPSTLDFDNAIRLAEDAREAAAIGVPPVRAVESAAVAPRTITHTIHE